MMTRPLNRQYTAKPLNFKRVQCIISNTRFQDLSFGKGIGHSLDKRHFRRFDNKNRPMFNPANKIWDATHRLHPIELTEAQFTNTIQSQRGLFINLWTYPYFPTAKWKSGALTR